MVTYYYAYASTTFLAQGSLLRFNRKQNASTVSLVATLGTLSGWGSLELYVDIVTLSANNFYGNITAEAGTTVMASGRLNASNFIVTGEYNGTSYAEISATLPQLTIFSANNITVPLYLNVQVTQSAPGANLTLDGSYILAGYLDSPCGDVDTVQ